MSFSGATGRGTYQAIIAGTAQVRKWNNSYFSLAPQLMELRAVDNEIRKRFFVRDKQFDTRFSAFAMLKGSFKHVPAARTSQHVDNIMPAIRRRTMLLSRIRRQQAINKALIEEAAEKNLPDPRQRLMSRDANAYFAPESHRGTVAQPNYWQHATNRYLLPKMNWRRHPELGGITRVHKALPKILSRF